MEGTCGQALKLHRHPSHARLVLCAHGRSGLDGSVGSACLYHGFRLTGSGFGNQMSTSPWPDRWVSLTLSRISNDHLLVEQRREHHGVAEAGSMPTGKPLSPSTPQCTDL